MRVRKSSPAARAAWIATWRACPTSKLTPWRLALETRGGRGCHVLGWPQHNRSLIARGLTQIARDACLGVSQSRDSLPRLVLVDHAQAFEWTHVDAVAATATD